MSKKNETLPLGILIDNLFNPETKNKDYLRSDKCPKQDRAYGCNGEALEPHTCPFKEDINGDHETLCTCCEPCQNGCAQDI